MLPEKKGSRESRTENVKNLKIFPKAHRAHNYNNSMRSFRKRSKFSRERSKSRRTYNGESLFRVCAKILSGQLLDFFLIFFYFRSVVNFNSDPPKTFKFFIERYISRWTGEKRYFFAYFYFFMFVQIIQNFKSQSSYYPTLNFEKRL